jgi:hypothetical protein
VRTRASRRNAPARPGARALRLGALPRRRAPRRHRRHQPLLGDERRARRRCSEVYIQQVYWLVFGGILATLVAAIDYRHYERLGYALYAFGVVLCVLVFILGEDIRGSSRWIYIGSFSFSRASS